MYIVIQQSVGINRWGWTVRHLGVSRLLDWALLHF